MMSDIPKCKKSALKYTFETLSARIQQLPFQELVVLVLRLAFCEL